MKFLKQKRLLTYTNAVFPGLIENDDLFSVVTVVRVGLADDIFMHDSRNTTANNSKARILWNFIVESLPDTTFLSFRKSALFYEKPLCFFICS